MMRWPRPFAAGRPAPWARLTRRFILPCSAEAAAYFKTREMAAEHLRIAGDGGTPASASSGDGGLLQGEDSARGIEPCSDPQRQGEVVRAMAARKADDRGLAYGDYQVLQDLANR